MSRDRETAAACFARMQARTAQRVFEETAFADAAAYAETVPDGEEAETLAPDDFAAAIWEDRMLGAVTEKERGALRRTAFARLAAL